ncbi:MAG: hypothetical protein LBR85_08025 [Oscillospiraceae bacterium]|nr:hypothetical protein [Oscillospiraceae bacterium]
MKRSLSCKLTVFLAMMLGMAAVGAFAFVVGSYNLLPGVIVPSAIILAFAGVIAWYAAESVMQSITSKLTDNAMALFESSAAIRKSVSEIRQGVAIVNERVDAVRRAADEITSAQPTQPTDDHSDL